MHETAQHPWTWPCWALNFSSFMPLLLAMVMALGDSSPREKLGTEASSQAWCGTRLNFTSQDCVTSSHPGLFPSLTYWFPDSFCLFFIFLVTCWCCLAGKDVSWAEDGIKGRKRDNFPNARWISVYLWKDCSQQGCLSSQTVLSCRVAGAGSWDIFRNQRAISGLFG